MERENETGASALSFPETYKKAAYSGGLFVFKEKRLFNPYGPSSAPGSNIGSGPVTIS